MARKVDRTTDSLERHFGKFKLTDVLKFCWIRSRIQKWSELPEIIIQEFRFAKIAKLNKNISGADLYKLLTHLGALDPDKEVINTRNAAVEESSDPKTLQKIYSEQVKVEDSKRVRDWRDSRGDTQSNNDKEVTLKNLTIIFDDAEEIEFGNLDAYVTISSYRFHFYRRIKKHYACSNIKFENCLFISLSRKNSIYSKISTEWKIIKSEETELEISNCFFRGVNLNIDIITALHTDPQEISFKNVTAIGPRSLLNIVATFDKELDIHKRYSFMATDTSDASFCGIILENLYFHQCRINAVNLVIKGNTKISEFILTVLYSKLTPQKGTEISKSLIHKAFTVNNSQFVYPRINFGQYQKISPPSVRWQSYKDVLIELRELAEKRKDGFQAGLLNREIIKCDHALIRQEKVRIASMQDRFTLFINEWLTDYGVSWMRPLVLLILLNLIFACIVSGVTVDDPIGESFIYFFAQTFNPISYLFGLGESELATYKDLIVTLHVIQKAVFALCLYEIIRVGRRHTRYSNN